MKLFKVRGDILSKLGLIALATALAPLTGVSGYAADKITLTCSGTMWVKGLTEEGQAPNPSFVIDLDEGIVTSSLGEFAITELTPSRISFKAKHGKTHRCLGFNGHGNAKTPNKLGKTACTGIVSSWATY